MKPLERRRFFDLLDQAETRIEWECGSRRRRKRKAGENVGEQLAGLPSQSTEIVCEKQQHAQAKAALPQEGLGQENEAVRLLGVDSAALLTQDSGWGSEIVISGRAWPSQSTDLLNASPSNSATASGILVESFQDDSFVGLGDASDVEEQEEDCSEFVPLVTMCSELSLDDKFLEASTPPHLDDECRHPKPEEENNKRNEDSCSWFYGNVAKIGKRDQAQVLDAWIHHLNATSTEPFRLAVLLLAKASIQNSGSKNLAFPEIAKEYLTTWPSSGST